MAGDGPSDAVNKYPEFKFYKPEDMKGKSKWLYIYNAKEKSFLGRTKKKWGVCLLFYLTFYLALVTMWVILFYVSMTLYWNHEGPWRILEDSRIGGNPSLIKYPSTDLITIKSNKKEFIHQLNELLLRYQKLNPDDYSDCQASSSNPEDCYFDANEVGNCTQGGSYGYNQNTPCVMLKINKVYAWKPKVYSDSQDLPNDMPNSLKNYINQLDPQKRNMIWVSCEEDFKKESNLKEINYWPGQGFPAYFYPFMGKEKHLNPIVAVQFVSKKSGVSMKIECRAWAKDLTSTTTFTIIFDE